MPNLEDLKADYEANLENLCSESNVFPETLVRITTYVEALQSELNPPKQAKNAKKAKKG